MSEVIYRPFLFRPALIIERVSLSITQHMGGTYRRDQVHKSLAIYSIDVLSMPLMKRIALFVMAVVATGFAADPQPIDITKREVTDPLLRISTSTSLLPKVDDRGLNATRDDKHNPPVYRRIFGQQDVIMLEPFSREKHAQIDFSAITKEGKGVLRLGARNHPAGDFILEIVKGGTSFKKETIGANKWERYNIPFDHEEILVKNFANGWHCEFAFIDYSIAKAP